MTALPTSVAAWGIVGPDGRLFVSSIATTSVRAWRQYRQTVEDSPKESLALLGYTAAEVRVEIPR